MLKQIQKKFISYFLSIAFLIISSVCQAEVSDEELLENAKKMEKIIEEGLEKIHIPAAVLSVSRANKPLYFKAFGKTTIPSNNPKNVTEHTIFPVSSVSKNVTAILVGALVDDGKIAFEDKVRKYYPEFFVCNEELSNEFTIMDLISHSSGFEHFSADTLFKAGYDNDKVLNAFRFLKQRPGDFRRHYGYQNIIYGIVGIVIEKATGEKYEDLLKKYVFDKMGIEDSSAVRIDAEESKWGYFKYLLSRFPHDKKKLGSFKASLDLVIKPLHHNTKQVATSHSRYIEEILPLDPIGIYQKFAATSGVNFSAKDFAKWLAMLANKGTYNGTQIVSLKTFEKLSSKIAEVIDIKDSDPTFVKERYSRDNLYYGMGMFTGTYFDNGNNGHKIIFHMGGIYGSTAFIAYCPDDNIAVGVACNLGGVAQTLFCEYMVNQFLDLSFGFSKIDWVQKDIDRKLTFRKKQAQFAKNLSEKNPTPMEELKEYEGTYTSELYGDITVSAKDGTLIISNGIKSAKLTNVNGSIFSFPSKDMSFIFFDENEYISFFKDDSGKINSFYISCFDENDTRFTKR